MDGKSFETKLLINYRENIVEAAGSEEFVRFIYEDFKGRIATQPPNSRPSKDITEDDAETENGNAHRVVKKRRKAANQPQGASCRARILQLRQEKFFASQRSPTDIVVGLKAKGWTHTQNQVGAALTQMFSKGELQRTGASDGNFKYFWDRT